MDNLAVTIAAGASSARILNKRLIYQIAGLFSIAHFIMFSLGFLGGESVVPVIGKVAPWCACAALVYIGVSVTVTLKLKGNIPGPMLAPMILYLAANSTMNLAAMAQLMSVKSAGALVAYIGAVFFFISDCTLYLVRYHKNKDLIFKKHFTVMLTYLLGECLITVGLLLL